MIGSELKAKLPPKAQRMSNDSFIYYLNYPVKEDILALVQAQYPTYYERNTTFSIDFPELDILSIADNTNGGITCSVALTTLQDGDAVSIAGTSSYNGLWIVSNTTGASFDLDITFVDDEAGTATIDARIELPDDCIYPTEVQPDNYPRVDIGVRDLYQKQPYTISVDDTELVVPVGSPYRHLQLWYMREVPLITSLDDELPYPTKAQRQLVSVLNYGACLEFFRDEKMANDIIVYRDKYEQAKMNIARLSVQSLSGGAGRSLKTSSRWY